MQEDFYPAFDCFNKTETEFLGEKIYAIDTVSNKGESLIRFGNETQMLSILVGYKYSVVQDGDYKAFMKERYYHN